ELAALMASDASRHERFSGFLSALDSPLRPVIAVVEDVHWADDATRDMLIYLARRVENTHAVVVVTFRDDEVGPEHPLRAVLGHVSSLASTHRVSLSPLSAAAVAELAGSRSDAERVYRVTGGNPFFVTELVAAGADTVPRTVGDAVLTRAAQLTPAGRAALEAASIAPDRVELDLVRALVGDQVHGIDECVQVGLLLGGGRTVRFRHELARLAVEQSISATRVPELHSRALGYLSLHPETAVARLAYHADQAGDREAILRYAPAAAEQASRLGAHHEAAAHYRRALDVGGGLPAREHAELLEKYAEECTAIDRAVEAIDVAGLAIDRWLELGEVDRAAVVQARRAYLLWGTGRNDDARDAIRAALALLDDRAASIVLATVYTYSAHLHMLAREIPDAIRLGERAVEMAERDHDVALLARALNIVGAAQWFVDPDSAEETLTRALDAARRSGDDSIVGIVMRMLGSGGGEVRRYRTADHWLREAVRWCAEHDLDIHGDYCLAWSARTALEQGRWTEAASLAEKVARRPTEHTPTRITALTALGRLRVRRGDPDPDGPLEEAWRLALRTGDLQRLWPAAAGRAEAAWLTGRPEQVEGLVAETLELAVRLNQQWPIGELAFWLWRAGELRMPPRGAAEPYALQVAGDWRGAAAAWEAIGCPYEVAFALADSDAVDDLQAALEAFARMGARPMADRVAARLRELGVRRLPRQPTRETLENPGGLTDRELEVLALLVDGHTNVDIGRALHISPKTAGHHVSAILAKLGVSSRRDAARTAREWGITPSRMGNSPPGDRAPRPM
ncbi:MAG TPA: LuxR C-terminal-related transcriptional regulator, partial [Jiangellaceae bacterium]|nr:LuxR C-terminal-related transcriptional regulator [Jiangellaceae bacterium]